MSDEEKIQIAALGLLGILGRKPKRTSSQRSPQRRSRSPSPRRSPQGSDGSGGDDDSGEDDNQPKRDALAKKLKENNDTLQRAAAEAKGLLTLLKSRKKNAELKGDSKTAGEMGMRIDQLTEAYDGAISNFASTLDEDQLSLAEKSNRILELTIKYMRRLEEETPEERTERLQRDANDDLLRRKTGQPRKRRGTLELLTGIPEPVETEKKRRGTLELLTGIPQPNKTDNSVSDRAQYLEAFRKYDTDESGSISLQELSKGYEAVGLNLKDALEAMGERDLDMDGELSFDEFLTWGLDTDALEKWGSDFEKAKANAEVISPVAPVVKDLLNDIDGLYVEGAKTKPKTKPKKAEEKSKKAEGKKKKGKEEYEAEVMEYLKENDLMSTDTKYKPLKEKIVGKWFLAVDRFNKKGEYMALTYLFYGFMNAATGRDKGIKQKYNQKDLKNILGDDAFNRYVYKNLAERKSGQKILPSGDEKMAALIRALVTAWQGGVEFKQYVPKAKPKGSPKKRQNKQRKSVKKEEKKRENKKAVKTTSNIEKDMGNLLGVPTDPADADADIIDKELKGDAEEEDTGKPTRRFFSIARIKDKKDGKYLIEWKDYKGGDTWETKEDLINDGHGNDIMKWEAERKEEDLGSPSSSGDGDKTPRQSSTDSSDEEEVKEEEEQILLDSKGDPFGTIQLGFLAVRRKYKDNMKGKLFRVRNSGGDKIYKVEVVRKFGPSSKLKRGEYTFVRMYTEPSEDAEEGVDITGSELLPQLRF